MGRVSDMFYELLGRAIWGILRGYLRYQFPNARRNIAVGAGAGLLLLGGVAALAGSRRSKDGV